MKFQFNVNTNDQDYLDYNKFWMLRSHYGKKQMTTFRIIFAVIIGVYIVISLYGGNFTFDTFIGIIPMAILLILFELLLSPVFVLFLKSQLKSLKKKEKWDILLRLSLSFMRMFLWKQRPIIRPNKNIR